MREEYTELLKRRNPDGRVRIFILAFGAPNQGDTSKLEKIACANNGYFSKVYNYGDVVPAISNILAVFGCVLSSGVQTAIFIILLTKYLYNHVLV